jgi:hypothetical protein
LDDIHQAAQSYDVVRLKELLAQYVEGYVPDMNITGMMPINHNNIGKPCLFHTPALCWRCVFIF